MKVRIPGLIMIYQIVYVDSAMKSNITSTYVFWKVKSAQKCVETKTRAAERHESKKNTCFTLTIWEGLPWPWACARSLEGNGDGWADLPDPDRRPIHLLISGTSSPRGSAVYFLSVWVYQIKARSKRALAEIRNPIETLQFRMLFSSKQRLLFVK